MSSFQKLIDAAKNQPIEEEAPVDLIPETSTNDSTPKKTKKVSSKNETSTNGLKKAPSNQKVSSKNRNDTNTPVEAPISDQKESSKKNTVIGKRNNSDYRQTTIYVRKDVHRKLVRLLEDEGYTGDFSDWVEECMRRVISDF